MPGGLDLEKAPSRHLILAALGNPNLDEGVAIFPVALISLTFQKPDGDPPVNCPEQVCALTAFPPIDEGVAFFS